ncbi:MAG: hypothetical protein HYX53_05225 [Chloroflexi bacterium]|nr:hypothetical protein [Chloroflexota bacterium]
MDHSNARATLQGALVQPLMHARETYRDVQRRVLQLAAGLEALVGARPDAAATPPLRPARTVESGEAPQTSQAGEESVDDLLDFQARVAAIEGVERVSMVGHRFGQVTMLVELGPPD